MKINSYKLNLKANPGYTIKLATVAFSVIGLLLLSITLLSLYGAQKVEQEYNVLVDNSIEKLKLVNDLHKNEEEIYQAVTAHISVSEIETKSRLEDNIIKANTQNKADTEQLADLLKDETKKKLFQNYLKYRQTYHSQLDYFLFLSRQNRTEEAKVYYSKNLLPAFKVQQEYLDYLSEGIKTTALSHGNNVLASIKKSINKFNALLLLAFAGIIISGALVRKFIGQLKRDNALLNTEIREREQLEEALGKNQKQYKALFNSNPIPMWVYDQNTLYFLEVNDAATEEYGYTKTEFMNIRLTNLFTEEDQQAFLQTSHKDGNQANSLKKIKQQRKDRSRFYATIESRALPAEENILPRLVVATNVHEQVEAVEQLEKNEKQLREVSSSIPGAVYQFQLTKDLNFKFNYISDGIQKVFGVSPDELYKTPEIVEDYVHPEDLRAFKKSILKSYNRVKPWELEFRIWQPQLNKYSWIKGHSLPTPTETGVVTWNGTIIDISTQKDSQDSLIRSEANLLALLDSSPHAIYLLDPNLKIISYNAEAAREVREHLLKDIRIGHSILDYLADTYVSETVQSHIKALQGKTIVLERQQGNLWFKLAFRPVKTSDNKVLAVALDIENISEQKQTLETIRKNEMQLERAQEMANLGNWEYDINDSILSWSDNIFKIYGLSKKYFIPSLPSVEHYTHSDDREHVMRSFKDSIAHKQTVKTEYRIVRPDGNVRNVVGIGEVIQDDKGRAVKIWGSVQDITDRKNAEREILEAKNLLQSTIENIPEIIFSTDASLKLTYVSPQSLEILGYASHELEGNVNLWTKGVHRDDFPQLQNQIIPKLKAGERQQLEMRAITRDGNIKWLLLRISPLLNEEGELVRIDGSAADMTFYKTAEAKKDELTEQLMVQNQNLQQFAYIVSHNLRAPIANILGLTTIYDRLNPATALNDKVIDNLVKSAQLLDSTIHDLNDLLTLRSEVCNVQETVMFDSVFEHIKESLAEEINSAKAKIDIDFNHAPGLTTIKSYLQSIMLNLVSNALKYRSEDRNLQLQVKTFKVADYICLAICDNGMGIDLEKEKGKIFGLYKRFHHSIEGKGLGLHLVKTQAELLGGKVDVESSVNVGTTFSVYFKA